MKDDLKFSIYDEFGNETICRVICSFINANNKKRPFLVKVIYVFTKITP